MSTSKWTKKDIRTLRDALDTFVLMSLPPSRFASSELEAAIRKAVSEKRQDIVLTHLRSTREMHYQRYVQNCQTIGNQLARFTTYGQPDELIDRFTKLAREEDAAHKKAEALVLRVVREGLPPEVATYDPLEKKARA